MIPDTLQENVLRELRFDPRVDASKIGVTATEDGVVTLTGTVNTYSEKLAAEQAAKRVIGVRAVANEIEVVIPGTAHRSDTDIAEAAINALKSLARPLENVTVVVKDGWVTLEGSVDFQYQKQDAAQAIQSLAGVRGITNNIRVRPAPVPIIEERVKKEIEEAFIRSARVDARNISVQIEDSKVILKGTVRSWAEKDEAENAAWAVPGIEHVEDRLQVVP